MDEIQKELIKAGRKDLAQKYYQKVASIGFDLRLKNTDKSTEWETELEDISNGNAEYYGDLISGYTIKGTTEKVIRKTLKNVGIKDSQFTLKKVNISSKTAGLSRVLDKVIDLTLTKYTISHDKTAIALMFQDTSKDFGGIKKTVNIYSVKEITID